MPITGPVTSACAAHCRLRWPPRAPLTGRAKSRPRYAWELARLAASQAQEQTETGRDEYQECAKF